MSGEWQVLSAGTWALDGMPAATEAIYQAGRMGLDIAGHVSRAITPQLMDAADLVIVMEQGHQEALRAEFPRNANKVHLLSEAAAGNRYDVHDPAAMNSDEGIPQEIAELIHDGFEQICALVRN